MHLIAKLPTPEETKIADGDPMETQITLTDESGDQSSELRVRASDKVARTTEADEDRKAEVSAAGTQAPHPQSAAGRATGDRDTTNKAAFAKEATLGTPDQRRKLVEKWPRSIAGGYLI
ncbi:hypothetical protein PC119_g25318 [Phytophthora cactorum]|nr:hypothetical protein PC119_g25318 [Phytophthora cactorum]KAG3125474.1 hypothetical protein C6341_g25779 [Phytophthora cactorum]KAG3194009.1 hypothetical protein PC128_g9712 [Phytophthora cactorum]